MAEGIDIITPHIKRIRIPFYDIYTSVFVIQTSSGLVVLDSGDSSFDVEQYVIPALGSVPCVIGISHSHGDHAGGLKALARAYPFAQVVMFDKTFAANFANARVLIDNEILCGCLRVINLKGHTEDSMAVYDDRSKALITFDCLQAYGVGRWRNGISDKSAYIESLNRVRDLGAEILIASHEYDPVGSAAIGQKAICKYIDASLKAAQEK